MMEGLAIHTLALTVCFKSPWARHSTLNCSQWDWQCLKRPIVSDWASEMLLRSASGCSIPQLVTMPFSQTSLTEKMPLRMWSYKKSLFLLHRRHFDTQNGSRRDTIAAPHLTADTAGCAEQTAVQTKLFARLSGSVVPPSLRASPVKLWKISAKENAHVGGLMGISPATHSSSSSSPELPLQPSFIFAAPKLGWIYSWSCV